MSVPVAATESCVLRCDSAHALVSSLASLPTRKVTLVAAWNLEVAFDCLASAATELADEARVLSRSWDSLPGHRELISESLDGLAKIALDVWPDWYIREARGPSESPSLTLAVVESRVRALGLVHRVNSTWLSKAVQSCLAGRLPRADAAFTPAVEAEQLSLALSPLKRIVVLTVSASDQPPNALLGLARVAEWLAAEADCSVIVLIPADLGDAAELESISYGRVDWVAPEPELPSVSHATSGAGHSSGPLGARGAGVRRTAERPVRLITPIIGRPHPNSLGEQLLWAALEKDAELRGHFQCNQRVQLSSAKCIVDLLDHRRRLVVEVDGYYWHSSEDTFSRDRSRDFRLLTNGYLVIRLPHDEVVADVEIALEKVRSLVRFRIEQLGNR